MQSCWNLREPAIFQASDHLELLFRKKYNQTGSLSPFVWSGIERKQIPIYTIKYRNIAYRLCALETTSSEPYVDVCSYEMLLIIGEQSL